MAATIKTSPLCSAIAWERENKNKCNFRSIFQKAEWTIFSLALANSPTKCLINNRQMKQPYRGLFWALHAHLQQVNWWNLEGWTLFWRLFPSLGIYALYLCFYICVLYLFLYVLCMYLYRFSVYILHIYLHIIAIEILLFLYIYGIYFYICYVYIVLYMLYILYI